MSNLMTKQKRNLSLCLYCLVAIHLGLVFGGACHWKPPQTWGVLSQILRWYGEMSGSDSGYSFFAPDVGPSYHATFLLSDQSGATWTDTLENGAVGESRLRLMNIVDKGFALGMAQDSDHFRRGLAESLAKAMFAKHPHAKRLTFQVEAMVVPRMEQTGCLPNNQIVYKADFVAIDSPR